MEGRLLAGGLALALIAAGASCDRPERGRRRGAGGRGRGRDERGRAGVLARGRERVAGRRGPLRPRRGRLLRRERVRPRAEPALELVPRRGARERRGRRHDRPHPGDPRADPRGARLWRALQTTFSGGRTRSGYDLEAALALAELWRRDPARLADLRDLVRRIARDVPTEGTHHFGEFYAIARGPGGRVTLTQLNDMPHGWEHATPSSA